MAELTFTDVNRLSHAYILSAPSPEESQRAAKRIAAAAVCSGQGKRPCGLCRSCRKAEAGIHPDIISLGRLEDDKGRPKREISVEQIRQMSLDAFVRPNEAERKIYIIREADTMNLSAQNAALKLLEEPPKGVVFLLCVSNAGKLLPTVRSRCVELALNGQAEAADEESVQTAKAYLRAVASGDPAELCRWCSRNEGMDLRATAAFTDSVSELLADMLCGRATDQGLSREALLRLTGLIERCRAYLRVNVGVKHIFGLLAVDSIAGGGNRG